MTDSYNDIIDRTIAALQESRYEHADGTPISGWDQTKGAATVAFARPALEAISDGLHQMIVAISDHGGGMSDVEKKSARGAIVEVIDELLYDTVQFNADVDPADTLADQRYDSRDQE